MIQRYVSFFIVRQQSITHTLSSRKAYLFEQQFSLVSVDFFIDTMLNCKLMFHAGKQDVREKEDLRYGERQCYSEIEIRVCRSGVNPLMPHSWRKHRAK